MKLKLFFAFTLILGLIQIIEGAVFTIKNLSGENIEVLPDYGGIGRPVKFFELKPGEETEYNSFLEDINGIKWRSVYRFGGYNLYQEKIKIKHNDEGGYIYIEKNGSYVFCWDGKKYCKRGKVEATHI